MLLDELQWQVWGTAFERADIPQCLIHRWHHGRADENYDIYAFRSNNTMMDGEWLDLDPLTAQAVLFNLTQQGNQNFEEV